MDPETQAIRIGELLVKAGFVTTDDLDEALEIAKTSGQLVGRVLVMSGFIEEHRLIAALRAQEHLRNGRLNLDKALRALELSDKEDISFDQALNQLKLS